jgi:hypothetical protein
MVTTYIAIQQYRGNQLKLRMDRYERRLRIYQEVVDILRIVCGETKPQMPEIIAFGRATAEADFLFGPEIPQYIKEIIDRTAKLHGANAEYRDITQPPPPPEYDHDKVVKEMMQQIKWFADQFPVAKEKFRKYMDVS